MTRIRCHKPSAALVISCIALIFAMGGTGYAAMGIAKNSVGTAQLRKGAVTEPKIAKKTLRALEGARGPAGPEGALGPAGTPGAAGKQGVTGATGPLGPTSGTSAGIVESPSGTGFNPFGENGSVTLPTAGKVLVEISGTFVIECSASGSCSATVAGFVDGAPVPGAWENLNAAKSAGDTENLAVSGIAVNVPAGTHTVQLETSLSSDVSSTNFENLHLTAVALGNS
ncbi:MAG TPA: hypothetical protein VMD09_05030 [Solirubrobacteraceae bacterium]|nr:hypothetical protein [Solirubrobacteraceae bacterium]